MKEVKKSDQSGKNFTKGSMVVTTVPVKIPIKDKMDKIPIKDKMVAVQKKTYLLKVKRNNQHSKSYRKRSTLFLTLMQEAYLNTFLIKR